MTIAITMTSINQHNFTATCSPAKVVLTEMDETLWEAAMNLAKCAGAVSAFTACGRMNDDYATLLRDSFSKAGRALLRRGDEFNDAVAWHLMSECRTAADLMGELGILTPSQEAVNERQPVLGKPDVSDPVWVLMNYLLSLGRQTAGAIGLAFTAEGEECASDAVEICNEIFEWLHGRPLPQGIQPLVFQLLGQVELTVETLPEFGYDISL